MDGPSIRTFPRTALDHPIQLLVGKQALRAEKLGGNLSAGGVFVLGPELPVGTPVEVKIAGGFRADGVVRYCGSNGDRGVGIEFTALTAAARLRLDQLIAELTEKGLPAC